MGLLFFILLAVAQAFFFWRIFEKAGYAGAWGLVALIPFASLFALGFLAFADWPRNGADPGARPGPGTFD
ncbi:MAG: hypothetical protein AAF253_00060 [Pseudomonadota bacterium]